MNSTRPRNVQIDARLLEDPACFLQQPSQRIQLVLGERHDILPRFVVDQCAGIQITVESFVESWRFGCAVEGIPKLVIQLAPPCDRVASAVREFTITRDRNEKLSLNK